MNSLLTILTAIYTINSDWTANFPTLHEYQSKNKAATQMGGSMFISEHLEGNVIDGNVQRAFVMIATADDIAAGSNCSAKKMKGSFHW